ncbi:MAG: hypothetical protein ACR2IS_19300 [Nitrososphaeraceae archaeon]
MKKKSIKERTIQHINDRTEMVDEYFPRTKERCNLQRMTNWLNLLVRKHNKEIEQKIWLSEYRGKQAVTT